MAELRSRSPHHHQKSVLQHNEARTKIPLPPPTFVGCDGQPWVVLRVKTGQEFVVQQHLAYREITYYNPTYQAIRRFPDSRPTTFLKPLLPGYFFVSYDRHQSTDLLSTPHVIGVITVAGRQAEISTPELHRIHAMTTLAGEPWQRLVDGDHVRVISGPLRGSEGRIVKHEGQLRMVIEITMLNRSVRVKIDGFELEAA